MLEVSALTKDFKGLRALHEVDARFGPGQSYALIGPNGSGKTTLIKCILGLMVPTSGHIMLNGTDVVGRYEHRHQIGYMPQIGRYPANMTIGQVMDMVCDLRGSTTAIDNDLTQAFGLTTMRHKPMHTLSGGTRQKVSAALAFMFNPPILILDEPTAGLDPLAAETLKEKVLAEKQKGKTIMVTSHILSDLEELTTHLVYFNEGKLAYTGQVEAIKESTGQASLVKAIAHIMRTSTPLAR